MPKEMLDHKVVARDGIEPPTPAFSGPRSTTELSGLGREDQRMGRQVRRALVRFESPAWGRDLTVARTRMVLENVDHQYSNHLAARQSPA
jgi:hypothetical protein